MNETPVDHGADGGGGNKKPPSPAPAPPPSPRQPSNRDVVAFLPTHHHHLDTAHELFPTAHPVHQSELMGPLLRRKKVVSMPLGAGGDFFVHQDAGGPHRQLFDEFSTDPMHHSQSSMRRVRQQSYSGAVAPVGHLERQVTPPTPRRIRQGSLGLFGDVLRRKQVSLDLLGPNDFFATPAEVEEMMASQATLPAVVQEEGEEEEGEVIVAVEPKGQAQLFRPLRFAPRMEIRAKRGGHHGSGAAAMTSSSSGQLATIDEETTKAFDRYNRASADLQLQMSSLMNHLQDDTISVEQIKDISNQIASTQSSMNADQDLLQSKLSSSTTATKEGESLEEGSTQDGAARTDEEQNDELVYGFDDEIIRATRGDKIKTGVLFVIMLALTLVATCWDTHLDVESFVHSPVGMACVTDCPGNLDSRDFFNGHNHFETDQVIQLIMHMDPNEEANHAETYPIVEIVGSETGQVKATVEFGSPGAEDRMTYEESLKVTFDHPDEHHILNIVSSNSGTELSFTLSATVLTPLADYSEIVAALIMVVVYLFILIEVIHRTLVAIFGSMVALMFFFIMHNGETESIAQLMLHLEWSTLGLLFGMMLIVGELSHTGVFEWCSVRLLVASKGSFIRLMVLLCTLTAIASAFLDNVTTMLLVAPVTIDMCNILQVDPRPYLIGEVLLSNIGGTATLIGDPPNIIIGSSFEEIGFVDFIIHVLPAIFVLCIPVSLGLVCWVYRYYLTSTKMRVLDTAKLKQTYPIYDEPRLLIAGTVTFFVIIMFFLHPVHHKDTAWIALLGAFICIAFTNPHDVQEALRSHVEWDTLLFFAGLFVLVEVCAAMGLLELIGDALADLIEQQEEEKQLAVAITLILWVSAVTSAFLDNIPYTATMIPIVQILSNQLPDTLPIETLAWALSFGACLGGNGTLLGASANIVTAGISTNKGFEISFLNFFYPGMLAMIATVAIANLYMLVRYAWI